MAGKGRTTPATPNKARSGYMPSPMMKKGQQQKGATKNRTT
jgi:hypothetical protein